MIASLPPALSHAAYFWMQRRFGGLRVVDPTPPLRAAVETSRLIQRAGHDPRDKMFFEVGTGRVPTAPLAYWLMGAKGTATVDLNRYMRPEIVLDTLKYLSRNQSVVRTIFDSLLNHSRFDELTALVDTRNSTVEHLLALAGIEYLAPADAANTTLADGSIDFHTSYTVFEHIQPDVLPDTNEQLSEVIRSDEFRLDDRFRSKSESVLLTTSAWFVSRRRREQTLSIRADRL